MRLSLRQPELSPRSMRIFVDGVDVTESWKILSIKVTWGAAEATKATLTVMPDELDIDTETLTHLAAHVKEEVS